MKLFEKLININNAVYLRTNIFLADNANPQCLIKHSLSLVRDLEIVREFRASCIARVHRYGHEAVGIEFEHSPFKVKVLQLLLDGPLDAEDLLGHYRQHLQLNTVELVEACPGTR